MKYFKCVTCEWEGPAEALVRHGDGIARCPKCDGDDLEQTHTFSNTEEEAPTPKPESHCCHCGKLFPGEPTEELMRHMLSNAPETCLIMAKCSVSQGHALVKLTLEGEKIVSIQGSEGLFTRCPACQEFLCGVCGSKVSCESSIWSSRECTFEKSSILEEFIVLLKEAALEMTRHHEKGALLIKKFEGLVEKMEGNDANKNP